MTCGPPVSSSYSLKEVEPPRSNSISQTNRLFSCLVHRFAAAISISVELRSRTRVPCWSRSQMFAKLRDCCPRLYLIDPDMAESLVESLGGEQGSVCNLFRDPRSRGRPHRLLNPIRRPRPHGPIELVSKRPNSTSPTPTKLVCEICETLIALSPLSNAAASDVIDPAGQTITVGSYQPWSKNIPRANLPPKTRVAWNVAFRQVLLARSATYSLTDYTSQIALLVRRTEKVFCSFTEKWIKKKRISNANVLASEINSIRDAVSALAYAGPERTPSTMTEPFRTGADDTIGALLTGILGNLVRRLSDLEATTAAATFAGNLHGQACRHCQSEIWRTIAAPPLSELGKLSERLRDVSCILHEMAHDSGSDAVRSIVRSTRKPSKSNFVRSRPISEHDSPYWPAREVAVLLKIEDLAAQWIPNGGSLLSLGKKHLENDWPFRTVPVMNGQVLASLALVPSSHIPLPDQNFAREWSDFVDLPLHSPVASEKFDAAVDACIQISAIIKCRGIKDLHSEEDEVLARAVNTFKSIRETLRNAADRTKAEHFELALAYLDRNWLRLVDEFKAVKAGRSVDDPLCMTPYLAIAGKPSEQSVELAAVRLAILQAELECLVNTIERGAALQ